MNKPYQIQKRVWELDFMLPVGYYRDSFGRVDFVRNPEYPKFREDITWLEFKLLLLHDFNMVSRWRNEELLEWLNALKF